MGIHVGIDCAQPFSIDLLARVTSAYGKIDFVGRYLEYLPGASTGLTTAEVADIHAHGIGILVVYNGAQWSDVGAGHAVGTANGQVAVRHAQALGVPAGCGIFCDVEAGWNLSASFVQGWIEACHAGGYVGGFYLNGQSQEHVSAYLAGKAAANLPAAVWSSEPEMTIWRGTRLETWYDFGQTPLGAHAADCCVHQYSENELGGSVDLDAATDAGLALMWHTPSTIPGVVPAGDVTPAASVRMQVINPTGQSTGLKSTYAHGGSNLATIPQGGQVLATNQHVNGWTLVQWRSQTGWVPSAYLKPLA